MTRHEWESRGDHAAFFIVRRSGERITVLIDLEDVERVLALRWCVVPHLRSGFYVTRRKSSPDSGFMMLHQFVTDAPTGVQIDHVHHDSLDNRKSKLRVTDRSGNMLNRKGPTARNKSGYRGVSLHKLSKLWHAGVTVRGKRHSLGYFKQADAAGAAVTTFLISNQLIPGQSKASAGGV